MLASFGHVRDLPSKNGSVEPEKDFEMHYEVDSDAQKKMKDITVSAKECDEVILVDRSGPGGGGDFVACFGGFAGEEGD